MGDGVPGGLIGVVLVKDLGSLGQRLPGDTVAMAYQATDFPIAETVHVGADVADLLLDFRMGGSRILFP